MQIREDIIPFGYSFSSLNPNQRHDFIVNHYNFKEKGSRNLIFTDSEIAGINNLLIVRGELPENAGILYVPPSPGNLYLFSVRCAIMKHSHNRRVIITDENEILHAFKNKMKGFNLTNLKINSYKVESCRANQQNNPLIPDSVITGLMEITEPLLADPIMLYGIGKYRGYGYGLIIAAPVQRGEV